MIRDRFDLGKDKLEEIVWINSSCCKLKYHSEEEAKNVLESNVTEKESLKVKVDQLEDSTPKGNNQFLLRLVQVGKGI